MNNVFPGAPVPVKPTRRCGFYFIIVITVLHTLTFFIDASPKVIARLFSIISRIYFIIFNVFVLIKPELTLDRNHRAKLNILYGVLFPASIYHYYDLNENMSLASIVVCIEAGLIAIYIAMLKVRDDNCCICLKPFKDTNNFMPYPNNFYPSYGGQPMAQAYPQPIQPANMYGEPMTQAYGQTPTQMYGQPMTMPVTQPMAQPQQQASNEKDAPVAINQVAVAPLDSPPAYSKN